MNTEKIQAVLARMAGQWTSHPDAELVHANMCKFLRDNAPAYGPAADLQNLAAGGRFENEMVLGNHFLQLTFRSRLRDQEYISFGYLGFNRATNEFVEFWADSVGTVHFLSTSKFEVTDGTIRLVGEHVDPVTGAVSRKTSVYTVNADSTLVHRISRLNDDGTETPIKTTGCHRIDSPLRTAHLAMASGRG